MTVAIRRGASPAERILRFLSDPYTLMGQDAQTILDATLAADEHFYFPITTGAADTRRKFDRLAATWRKDTMFTSSVREMAMHGAYQQIIGMGEEAIPLLLSELQKRFDHWFWALIAITGVDPVPSADRGNVRRMAEAWVRWGKTHEYL